MQELSQASPAEQRAAHGSVPASSLRAPCCSPACPGDSYQSHAFQISCVSQRGWCSKRVNKHHCLHSAATHRGQGCTPVLSGCSTVFSETFSHANCVIQRRVWISGAHTTSVQEEMSQGVTVQRESGN